MRALYARMLLVRDIGDGPLAVLLERYGMQVERVASGASIPGSYWGESEAGLVGSRLIIRDDTPVHSALHEAAHFVCMDATRRGQLHRDAGGDHDEENAVCYLQILLADHLPEMNRAHMQADMDEWGYTFRLGSAQSWFERDAEDARRWLRDRQIIEDDGRISWRVRS